MMSWPKCDSCDSDIYTLDDPFVKHCQRRPSDPADMCCTMWGHWSCVGGNDSAYSPVLPAPGKDWGGAIATPHDLEEWIESKDAAACGYIFLT